MIFNAQDVLQIAVKIEQNGQAFYRKAAEVVSDPDAAKALIDLADWEVGHEILFKKMLTELENADFSSFDPDGVVGQYLANVADGKVFDLEKLQEDLDKITDDLWNIYELAIQREKEAVVFFSALKHMIPDGLGQEKVEDVVTEEIGHINFLTNRYNAL